MVRFVSLQPCLLGQESLQSALRASAAHDVRWAALQPHLIPQQGETSPASIKPNLLHPHAHSKHKQTPAVMDSLLSKAMGSDVMTDVLVEKAGEYHLENMSYVCYQDALKMTFLI